MKVRNGFVANSSSSSFLIAASEPSSILFDVQIDILKTLHLNEGLGIDPLSFGHMAQLVAANSFLINPIQVYNILDEIYCLHIALQETRMRFPDFTIPHFSKEIFPYILKNLNNPWLSIYIPEGDNCMFAYRNWVEVAPRGPGVSIQGA